MHINSILSLAVIFIFSFFLSRLLKKIKIPAITAYIILGIILSPGLLNLISRDILASSDIISNIVLGMIAFSLGENFSSKILRQVGRAVAGISISATVVPFILVSLFFWLVFNQPLHIALVAGAIASATDPATIVAVTQEYRSKGEFTDTLLGIVAVDDAWALIIFGVSLSLARSFLAQGTVAPGVFAALTRSCIEIGMSFLIGMAAAVLFDKFSHHINTVKERLIYTLGFLFLVVGVTSAFGFSVLLSCMFFGAVLANSNRMSFEFFDSLREIDAPLYLIFFVLAGAHLKIEIFMRVVGLASAFIVVRSLGKFLGAFLGAKIVDASSAVKKYMGFALLPQAGVALGCALVAKHSLGGIWGDWVLNITIATTVVFELIGPFVTKLSLVKSQNIRD